MHAETFEEMMERHKKKFRDHMARRRGGLEEPVAKKPFISISLGLGDLHHNPLRENFAGAKKRIAEALKLMKKLVPKNRWFLVWDEDAYLVAPATKAGVERLKKLDGAYEDDQCWNWEGPVIDGYNLSAQVTTNYQPSDSYADFRLIKARDLGGVLEAAFQNDEERYG